MWNYDLTFSQLELFLLIFARIATFCYVAPFYNTANTPRRIKIGLAFCVSVIAWQLYPEITYEYSNMIEYSVLILKEFTVGLLIGVVGNMTMQIIHFAGRFIDMDMGLSMASVMDPTNKTQSGIVGSIYYYLVLMLLIISGMHQYVISAIVESFRLIPVGQMQPNLSLYDSVVGFMGEYCVIGFRIALPIFACMLLLNCVLAIMTKVAPHMNMFVMGMQLKIIGGLIVLVVVIVMLPVVANFLYTEMKTMMYEIVEGLM
jgi:flagellar biosynthetic protein FliR